MSKVSPETLVYRRNVSLTQAGNPSPIWYNRIFPKWTSTLWANLTTAAISALVWRPHISCGSLYGNQTANSQSYRRGYGWVWPRGANGVKPEGRDWVFVWLYQANIKVGDDIFGPVFSNRLEHRCFNNGVVKFKTFNNNFWSQLRLQGARFDKWLFGTRMIIKSLYINLRIMKKVGWGEEYLCERKV